MKTFVLSALSAAIISGCSSQGDAEPPGASFAGGQTTFGGQTGFGGQSDSGGQPAAAGQTGVGGQTASGGQTAIGGAWIASGGVAGASTGGSSQGGAAASAGAPGSGGFSDATGGAPGPGGFPGTGAIMGAGGAPPGDAGFGGNPGSYRPCPTNGAACKVLPLGDSITYGVGDEGNAGYRGPLFATAIAAQQKMTFTGSLSNGPAMVSGQPFPKNNEGHSGWGISTVTQYSGGVAGIATLIPNPAFAPTSGGLPNVILLHIGTNDVGNSTAAQMSERLAGLIDEIVAAAPDALLVVAEITPLSWAASTINSYNASIPGLIQTRAAAGKHVALADMNTGFTSTMIGSDGIHPNSIGYKFMADRWYAVIGPLLSK